MKIYSNNEDELTSIYNSAYPIIQSYIDKHLKNINVYPIYLHYNSLLVLGHEDCNFEEIITNRNNDEYFTLKPFLELTSLHTIDILLLYNSWEYTNIENPTFITNYYKLLKQLNYPLCKTILSVNGCKDNLQLGFNFQYTFMRNWSQPIFIKHNVKSISKKRFVFLNRKFRFERFYLFALFNKYDILNHMYVSFLEIPNDSHYEKLKNYQYIESNDILSVRKTLSSPLVLDKSDPDWSNYDSLETFLQNCICIISETLPTVYEDIFISEKTTKPLCQGCPFIIYGSPYLLKQLRNMGFQTFHPYINETYDIIIDDSKRLLYIYEEIKRISQLSHEEYRQLFTNIIDIIEYNKNHYQYITKGKLLIDFAKKIENYV